ncbi:5'-nucleotidase C-terminal domain-containing protein [Bacillus sp. FJAT-27916]|uniref:5'-nucleotidase C-terminal domain-containing protein n=1 Tax=Bacillus sp. FJAT-27916 TaxID=1679169 RepID=UPI00069F0F1A|nr:5'-nucleotidase C-terminal domain-containing protein [Bacillus sp. FJAT-27916]
MKFRLKFYRMIATFTMIAALAGTLIVPAAGAKTADRQGEAGFIQELGISQESVKKQTSITRADAASLMARALKLDKKKAPNAGFTDVPKSSQKAINSLAYAGILEGKNGKKFGSNNLLTRGELAVWIAKAFDLKGSTEIHFTDVPAKHKDLIGAVILYDIADGISETKFGYSQRVSLSEFLTMLQSAIKAPDYQLRVLHVNDTHANIENTPRQISAIYDHRKGNTNNLLLHAGDVFSGTLYFNEFKGLADLELMNLAGFDAMTFGNHEFDLGSEALAPFVQKAQFPFVSANVDFSADTLMKNLELNTYTNKPKNGKIYDGIIKNVNGEKVGIFGLTTAETASISSPGDVKFDDYISSAKASVKALKKQGVDKIIALTHIGYNDGGGDNDLELANQVEGIDVIVGGHSHTQLDKPVVVKKYKEPTVIVQANEYSKFLGELDVSFDKKGKVIAYEGELISVDAKNADGSYIFADDPVAAQILAKYKPIVDAKKNQVVGSTTVDLIGGNPAARTGETNLGNLIADGMLAKAKTINPNTVIALQNGGGVRTTLKAGPITLADVMTVLPFSNALAIMEIRGSELKTALEHSVKDAPAASGGFLQVSGMRFTYDSSKPTGQRVQTVEVLQNGEYSALSDTETYYAATNIFTAKGGDGYSVFADIYADGRVSEPGFVDWEIFSDYIQSFPDQTVAPGVEGRIIDVKQ